MNITKGKLEIIQYGGRPAEPEFLPLEEQNPWSIAPRHDKNEGQIISGWDNKVEKKAVLKNYPNIGWL